MPESQRLAALVHTARAVANEVVAPLAEAEDRDARWPAEAMRALGDAGLLGLNVPQAQGGHGEGLGGLVAVAETLAAESASTAMCFAMHCVGTAVIAAKATDWQKQAYLEPIARGQHVTTLALSEPGTGAHFYLPETEITSEGDAFRLDGTKSFVTNGGYADSYVVSTRAAAEAGGEGAFSCVLVDEGTPGLKWAEPWAGLGMRGNSSRGARLEGVRVPRRNLLGNEGDQLWYVFEVVAPYFLMAMAGTYAGVAQAALDLAREHLGTRRFSHSGELLGSEPVLAHRLGEMYVEVERTRRMVHAAADRADAADPGALVAVLGCKAAAGDTAVRVANEAMTLCGGIAYRDNSRLARILRDARAAHVMAPTTDILKTWTGRALLNLPLV
jgi:alkylation response protein AidB-like acyl-CoA dehydrogenase